MRWRGWLVFLGMVLMINGFSFLEAQVSVRITEEYVLPVAELASTKTYPEIIVIENDLIAVSLIPNRGRILSSYALKSTQEATSLLYRRLVPVPMVLPGGLHVVEFGGYYLSLPWNDRDRQPLDLNFEITEKSEDRIEVFLSGKDLLKKTLTECWVRVKDNSPLVEIETKITNTSKRDRKTLTFKDFMVVNVDGGCRLTLPVHSIKILESRENWAGEAGEILTWPAPFGEWDKMEGYFRAQTEGPLNIPAVGLWYPEKGIVLMKIWEPEDFFQGSEVWSWGKLYKDEPGADAYIVTSSLNERFMLEPQGEISFKTYIVAFEEPSWDGEIGKLFEKVQFFFPQR